MEKIKLNANISPITDADPAYKRFANPEYREREDGKTFRMTTVGVRKGGSVPHIRSIESHLIGPNYLVRRPFYRTRVVAAKLETRFQEFSLNHQNKRRRRA